MVILICAGIIIYLQKISRNEHRQTLLKRIWSLSADMQIKRSYILYLFTESVLVDYHTKGLILGSI